MDKSTPEEVIKIIQAYYIKHYGKLSDPGTARDGYFISGFVYCSLTEHIKNSLTSNSNSNGEETA